MISKGLAIILVTLATAGVSAQTPVKHAVPVTQAQPAAPQAPIRPDCGGVPCEDQQLRTITVVPSPAPAPWPMHDKILWAALLVLTIVGYAGVTLAVSTLKKIEANTAAAVTASNAAAETAHAALLHAQALLNAERPWVLVTAEPVPGVESSYEIKATNGGRSPARITEALDQTVFVTDEAKLPNPIVYNKPPAGERFVPIILLPGESSTLMKISRDDARALSGTEDRFLEIESWKQRLFLCGKITYCDLIAPSGKQAHESNWCCWYIHGKQRSALVPAGSPALNSHT